MPKGHTPLEQALQEEPEPLYQTDPDESDAELIKFIVPSLEILIAGSSLTTLFIAGVPSGFVVVAVDPPPLDPVVALVTPKFSYWLEDVLLES